MYRILLVDDEIHICQLIEHLVNWEELGAEMCGAAHDGVEAYEMIQSLRPDIVLTDIRMSGMDGISLMEKAREDGFHCAFILISGYRQFEYAQRAIQLGVTDYLVKPIKKKELNAAIAKSIQSLRENGAEERPSLDGSRPVQRRAAVESVTASLGQMTPSDLAAWYGVHLSGPPRMLYGKCITCDESFLPEIVPLLFEHLKAQFLENDWFDGSFCAHWKNGCLLVGSVRQAWNLPAIQRQCQAAISMFANWRVILGSCDPAEGETFQQAADRAFHAANGHYFTPSEDVFSAGAAEPPVQFETVLDNLPLLSDAMQVLDAKKVRELVRADLKILETYRSPEEVFRYAAWTIDTMNYALSAFSASHSDLKGLQYLHRNELMEQLYYCSSILVLEMRLCGAFGDKIRSTREAIEQLGNKPVRAIREMVDARYMEQISLNDAARLVDLHPVYLSVLFKKETGVNFKDYVIKVRMENAKELLREGRTINQVAEMVGYQDPKYFSRLFARVVGVAPAQYKKLYQ